MDSNKNFGRKSADSNTLFENSTPNVTEPTMTGQEIPTKDYIQVPDFNSTGMDDKKPWAILEAKHFYYKSVQLTDKSFCFGRMNNDHLFNMDYIPQSSFFDNISRKHFSIKKHSDKVTITDHSHWGTYIQKSKIGKVGNGKSVQLEHEDIICIYKSDHQCYQFKLLDKEESVGEMLNEDVSANGSQTQTQKDSRKLSPSSVSLDNLREGKRTRFPKKYDDYIY